jgi:hypothetical protein
VNALLVTDGTLDFGDGDFGLSAFVDTLLNDGRGYVRFELTLAHLRADVTDAQVKAGEAGIARSIKGFRFDVASHFTSTMYDQVWLFGFESYYGGSSYGARANPANGYPTDRLKDIELDALTAHMNRQGGIFATGDHGGNPTKSPTVAHSFGLLSAYDGQHRAGVGRVICDSTWHHFVNVNLIGILEGGGLDDFGRPGEHGSKHDGFLSSSAGWRCCSGSSTTSSTWASGSALRSGSAA